MQTYEISRGLDSIYILRSATYLTSRNDNEEYGGHLSAKFGRSHSHSHPNRASAESGKVQTPCGARQARMGPHLARAGHLGFD